MTQKNRIKETREEQNLTLKELSNLSDIPYQTLRNYEIGKRKPRNDEVWWKLGTILNVRGPYLKGEDSFKTNDELHIYYLKKSHTNFELSKKEEIIDIIDKLNEDGLDEALRQLSLLSKIDDFKR